jgi:hypothetical protein
MKLPKKILFIEIMVVMAFSVIGYEGEYSCLALKVNSLHVTISVVGAQYIGLGRQPPPPNMQINRNFDTVIIL